MSKLAERKDEFLKSVSLLWKESGLPPRLDLINTPIEVYYEITSDEDEEDTFNERHHIVGIVTAIYLDDNWIGLVLGDASETSYKEELTVCFGNENGWSVCIKDENDIESRLFPCIIEVVGSTNSSDSLNYNIPKARTDKSAVITDTSSDRNYQSFGDLPVGTIFQRHRSRTKEVFKKMSDGTAQPVQINRNGKWEDIDSYPPRKMYLTTRVTLVQET